MARTVEDVWPAHPRSFPDSQAAVRMAPRVAAILAKS